MPGTTSSGSTESGCPSSLFAAALRGPVLESGLQSSGLILHLCTVLGKTRHGSVDEASLRCRPMGTFPWERDEVASFMREDPGCLDVFVN